MPLNVTLPRLSPRRGNGPGRPVSSVVATSAASPGSVPARDLGLDLRVAGNREPGDDRGCFRRAAPGVVAGGAPVLLSRYLHVRVTGQAGHLEGGRVAAWREPHLVAAAR